MLKPLYYKDVFDNIGNPVEVKDESGKVLLVNVADAFDITLKASISPITEYVLIQLHSSLAFSRFLVEVNNLLFDVTTDADGFTWVELDLGEKVNEITVEYNKIKQILYVKQ